MGSIELKKGRRLLNKNNPSHERSELKRGVALTITNKKRKTSELKKKDSAKMNELKENDSETIKRLRTI